jgi:hypothetical protein
LETVHISTVLTPSCHIRFNSGPEHEKVELAEYLGRMC